MNFSSPHENGWIKYFTDGTKIIGLDKDISTGKCSWSRSRLDNMNSCLIKYRGKTISINGHGDYWQSDDFESKCTPGTKTSSRQITRRIEKQLNENDMFVDYNFSHPDHFVAKVLRREDLSDYDLKNKEYTGSHITPHMYGYWLIVELDNITLKSKLYFSKERI